ncbi:MAG: hypothetical protein V1716_00420 [Candidatus Uhrbacteria bacterium]
MKTFPSAEVRRANPEQPEHCREQRSELLNQTTEIAQKFIDGEMDFDATKKWLAEHYKDHDQESYDCHSFLLSLLKRECGVSTMTAPEFTMPNRKTLGSSTNWQEALVAEIDRMFKSEAGQTYGKKMRLFTENIFKNSKQIPVPHSRVINTESLKEAAEISQKIVKKIIEELSDGTKSNVILFSDGRDEEFYDAHSTFVLGVTKDGQDLLILEKEEIGSSITVKRLSEVVVSYIFGWNFSDIEINICSETMSAMYPISSV